MKKDASFWSDIKALDERLKRDPDSFCFARLSEIYLKVGLVADALHTARAGVAKHPGYLAGQRSLGLACNTSGLRDEARSILERVTAAIPEDVEAQKILAELYVASGNRTAAINSYSMVLEFMPEDRGAISQLEYLRQTRDGDLPVSEPVQPIPEALAGLDEDIIELSESDIYEEPEAAPEYSSAPVTGIAPATEHHDPLSTLTLAELYEKQGFAAKALDIYRSILADDPTNEVLRSKIAELEGGESVSDSLVEEEPVEEQEEDVESLEPVAFGLPDAPFEDELVGSEALEPEAAELVESVEANAFEVEETLVYESAPEEVEPETVAEDNLSVQSVSEQIEETAANAEELFEVPSSGSESFAPPVYSAFSDEEPEAAKPSVSEPALMAVDPTPFAPLTHMAADNAVETLESWLENIRRIKACR